MSNNPPSISQAELEAYLDEALPIEAMSRIEQALRDDANLLKRLTAINARRDAGIHTLGEVWRRHRLSCATREQLGSYLLGVLEDGLSEYVRFHLETVGCRACRANLDDLQCQQPDTASSGEARRRKYFQSSAGHLQKKR